MARRVEKIYKKTTASGIEVTLLDNTLIKTYSKHYTCFMTFASHKEAKKEFSKFRHGKNRL